MVLKCVPGLGDTQALSGIQKVKTAFFYDTIICLFTLIFSQVCCGVFQKLYDTQCCNKLNAKSRTSWLSLSCSLNRIFKNVKQGHFSHWIFFFSFLKSFCFKITLKLYKITQMIGCTLHPTSFNISCNHNVCKLSKLRN